VAHVVALPEVLRVQREVLLAGLRARVRRRAVPELPAGRQVPQGEPPAPLAARPVQRAEPPRLAYDCLALQQLRAWPQPRPLPAQTFRFLFSFPNPPRRPGRGSTRFLVNWLNGLEFRDPAVDQVEVI